MTDIAVKVDNLGKQFRIGAKHEPYKTLRDSIVNFTSQAARFVQNSFSPHSAAALNMIWALKNVSFQVRRGEVIGIIGKNGSGKSTLLKILSRITEPTEGHAEIRGRVGALLEVGTGFHGELTGRENIYLNAAILGMRKREIERKFDEIVAFAEIDKFIDTPVKYYSSGMYVRLAFGVAAHLDPEILLVDEVLAVGDAAFQKKCLGKMEGMARSGRTILFVSHNLSAVSELCQSAILLEGGRKIAEGAAGEMVDLYLAELNSNHLQGRLEDLSSHRQGNGRLKFLDISLRNGSGKKTLNPPAGSPLDILLEYASHEDIGKIQFGLTIYNQLDTAVTHCDVASSGKWMHIPKGRGRVQCHIPKLPLPCGRYRIGISAQNPEGILEIIPTACIFHVVKSDFYPTSWTPPVQTSAALIDHSWKLVTK